VIAARSVVTKDVAPYTVVGGNPAQTIKQRFTDATVRKLLKLQWWHWSEEEVKATMPLICSEDIDALLMINRD